MIAHFGVYCNGLNEIICLSSSKYPPVFFYLDYLFTVEVYSKKNGTFISHHCAIFTRDFAKTLPQPHLQFNHINLNYPPIIVPLIYSTHIQFITVCALSGA